MKIKLSFVALLLACALLPAVSAQENSNNGNSNREPNNSRRPPRPPIYAGLPDLTIKSAKFIEAKDETRAIVIVSNAGKAPSPMCRLRLNVLKGVNKDSPLAKLWETDVPPLKPSEDATINIDIAPDKFSVGARTLIVDFYNKVKESNESNNESFSNFPPQGFK
ncbi:MAG: hypothetical protein QOE33_1700 [Acidobacteriota bacterium]|nr:hypothetical protein [Acidobacteriota bacterium]